MKLFFVRLWYLSLLITTIISCSKKPEQVSDETSQEWPEMESFHMVMAEAFHPYKDSANVEPAKKMAGELAVEAEQWQAAALPEKMNNDTIRGLLVKLKDDTRVLAEGVGADMTDEEIGKALTVLHDEFHEIVEKWHSRRD